MLPILFYLPLPHAKVPLLAIFLLAAAVVAGLAVVLWRKREARFAGMVGALSLVIAAGGFSMMGRNWEMGPLPIHVYGVMLGLSFLVGWKLTLGLAERDGLPRDTMANCYVVTALSALLGSRVLFVATNASSFTWTALVDFKSGGLVAYGGFLGGFLGSLLFLRAKQIPLLPWADAAVPSLASGLFFTRIGCYLFGCDFGRPLSAEAPGWLKAAGTFPRWPETVGLRGSPAWAQHVGDRKISPLADVSLPVHPTQIYEAVTGLALLGLLFFVRKHQKFRGELFFVATFGYGAARFALEILRDDVERGFLPAALGAHLLYPVALGALALGFALSFAERIPDLRTRRAVQALSFLPPVALALALRPAPFTPILPAQLSTSQIIGLLSGLAACAGFAVVHRAAIAAPAAAMTIVLPPEEDPRAKREAARRPEAPPPRPEGKRRKRASEPDKT